MSQSKLNRPASSISGKTNKRFLDDEQSKESIKECLATNDFRKAIVAAFNLDEGDDYVYHAIASVTLEQVQQVVDLAGANGLHKWYVDAQGEPLGNPSATDIEAYTSIFAPSRSAANTLKSLASNAKKGSLRAEIAANLVKKRHLDTSRFSISKHKAPHMNPYLDFWIWACQNLEWGGPTPQANLVRTSHAILPIFMHHFGCVVPSYEAVEVIRQVAKGRPVCDIGSGCGYWTFMLRQLGLTVYPVDDLQSNFRYMWVDDTIIEDGARWVRKRGGAADEVLLMVYPIVGRNFVASMLEAYKGRDIIVAGTQNQNGYTAFRDVTMDEWMAEHEPEFVMTARICLPSFAGKDEALFVFQKK